MSSSAPSTSAAPPPNGGASSSSAAAAAAPERPASPEIPEDILNASIDEIHTRTRLLDNDVKVMKSEHMRLIHEQTAMKQKVAENADKIRQNKILPYLVGNVVEVSGTSL